MQINKFGKKNSEMPLTRTKYVDPSKNFVHWAENLGLDQSATRRLFLFLERRFYLRRTLLLSAFCLLLSYIIFMPLEIPYEFNVGDTAKIDVTSTVGFEMVDEVTTEEKRFKAENAVPSVFDYDTGAYEKVATGVYRSFRQMRSLLHEQSWSKSKILRFDKVREFTKHKSSFEQALGAAVPDHMFEWLVENRFSSRIEGALLRNLERWYEKKISDSTDRYVPPGQGTVLIRSMGRGKGVKEYSISKLEIVDMQQPSSFELELKRGLEDFDEVDRANLTYLARTLIVPNMTLNRHETSRRKLEARESILPVTITIKKNQTIIARGATVQPFQMAIIKQIESIQKDRRKNLTAWSLAILLGVCILVYFTYLDRFTTFNLHVKNKDLYVMMLIVLGCVFMTKIFMFVTEAAFVARFGNLLPTGIFLYATPVAAGPMLVSLLINSGEIVWLFTSFLSICMGVMADFNVVFLLVIWLGGLAGARGVSNCKARNDIYFAGLRTGLVNGLLIATLLTIMKGEQDSFYRDIFFPILAGFSGGIFSSFAVMIFIPILESFFNYTTDVKLLELSNLNHPLLKEMIVRAPGTYHHSMMVGSMVEAAAEEIGANPLLGKVMCYYHDIGKVDHPQYFIENQKPGHNPHDHISPFMSKTLLIAHVKDGVERGVRHKLGKPIIDGILQHHGTTVIAYFFNKAQDHRKEEDPEISEEEFRYPGPKPQFTEAALCMLADSIEAAARSLDEPTPARLQNIVRNVIQKKFVDGQLDECNLHLRDIGKIESSFVRILLGIYHQRIDYPKRAGGGLSEEAKSSN